MSHSKLAPNDWFPSRYRKLICDNVNSGSFVRHHFAPAINNVSIDHNEYVSRACLSNSKKIYIFRCRATALYALTADSTGLTLPSNACRAGWQFEQSITLRLDKGSRKHELIRATLDAIAKHGFYLTHAAIQALPVDHAYNETEFTQSTDQLEPY